MRTVHVVVPDAVDDPARRSGGNVYDRRVCDGLRQLGWHVHEHALAGAWPSLSASAHEPLRAMLGQLEDGAVVLLDGLIASGVPELLLPHASRLRLVVLVHLPLGMEAQSTEVATRERAVLSAAAAVVATSGWTRSWLLARYGLDEGRVHVAEAGVDETPLAAGSEGGGELLCVAAVVPLKGQDLLVAALRSIPELPWRCVCVGSTTRDPQFALRVSRDVDAANLGERFVLAGNRSGADLDGFYARADVLVLPSRTETYGLVVSEALARGLPVIAADVGGVAGALGDDGTGTKPGLLVPPDDPAALAAALRAWLGDRELRGLLRGVAARRRQALRRWSTTAHAVAGALERAGRSAHG